MFLIQLFKFNYVQEKIKELSDQHYVLYDDKVFHKKLKDLLWIFVIYPKNTKTKSYLI